jgi:hypothetical protein
MNDIRARFEEIRPVPDGIAWSMNVGAYVCNDAIRITQELINKCTELDARLDTFTRCQETRCMVGVIVDDLIRELDNAKTLIDDGYTRARIACTIENAKQILGRKG